MIRLSKEQIKVYLYRNGCQTYPENEKGQKILEKEEKTEVNQEAEMSKNICRLDGNHIFLSVLRDDEEAVDLYAKRISDETTCVFIEHAHSVVDITRMPGWVSDHSVMRMGIVLKETDTLIGYCHIDHRTEDMSAWLSINIGEKSARGKGIGTEVVQILLRYCFMVLGVYSVHLDVLETNTPAIKCYEKAGFRISGRYRGHCYYMRNHYDWLHMDILYEEYLKN